MFELPGAGLTYCRTENRNRHETQFRELLHFALAPPVLSEGGSTTATSTVCKPLVKEEHDLFQMSALYFQESKTLLQAYQDLSNRESKSSTVGQMLQFMADDRKTALEAFTAGAKVTNADVKDLLADRYHKAANVAITREEAVLGRGLISRGTEQEETAAAWGNTAQHLHEVVEKMCDGL